MNLFTSTASVAISLVLVTFIHTSLQTKKINQADMEALAPPRTVMQCLRSAGGRPSSTHYQYTLVGSTRPNWHVQHADDHLMNVVERHLACAVRVACQNMADSAVKFLSSLPLPVHPATLPGKKGYVSGVHLKATGPLVVERVVFDWQRGISSIELSFSGLLVGPQVEDIKQWWQRGEFRVLGMKIPSLRMKVVISKKLVQKKNRMYLQIGDLSVELSIPESPHLVGGDGTNLAPFYSVLDLLLEDQMKQSVDNINSNGQLDKIARRMRHYANRRLRHMNLALLHPSIIESIKAIIQ